MRDDSVFKHMKQKPLQNFTIPVWLYFHHHDCLYYLAYWKKMKPQKKTVFHLPCVNYKVKLNIIIESKKIKIFGAPQS